MKPSTKSFILGMAAGFVLTLVVSVLALLIGSKIYSNHVKATIEDRIGPPPVPDSLDAAYDWHAAPLGGTPVAMDLLRGQTVVLTFWSPDCFSCTEQLEYMQVLADALSDTPIAIVAVSIAAQQPTKDAMAMLNVSFPVYVLEGDRPDVYETKTLPTTFVLTPKGTIAFRYAGIARWDDPAVAAYLRALATEHALAVTP